MGFLLLKAYEGFLKRVSTMGGGLFQCMAVFYLATYVEHPAVESTAGYSSAANSTTSPASSTDSGPGVRLTSVVGHL